MSIQTAVGRKQPHANVSKALVALVKAEGRYHHAARIAERDAPALKALPDIFQRAAVGAQPLGSNDPYKFAEEIYVALLVDGLRNLFARFTKVPARLKLPLENASGGNASWLGQGLASPVLKSTTAVSALEVCKVQGMTVLTKELFRFDPDSEATFMRILSNDVSRFLAQALFDHTKAATTANPAALTYLAPPIASTGSTAAQMIADLNSLISFIGDAMVDPVFVLRPKTYYRILATLAGVGLPATPGFLLGIPAILLSGMPQQITLLDCRSIFLASDEQATLSISTDSALEMSDAPSSSGISGTGAQLVSLYQSGLVGISAELTISWANPYMFNTSPQVPSGCTFMTVSY
jgi:hypothetical protein